MDWPHVTCVITTYKPATKRYLQLCLESIKNLDYPKDKLKTIVVCHKSQLDEYSKSLNYPNLTLIAPPDDSFHNPRGLNFGLEHAAKDQEFKAEHFLILNDDVILTRDSLTNLVRSIHGTSSIANGVSPCDNYGMYTLFFSFDYQGEKIPMTKKFYRLESFDGDFLEVNQKARAMMMAKSAYPQGALHVPFLCMYATLIPRPAYEKLGGFDEKFKTGQDDLDYSYRARQAKIPLVCCLDSLIWHFGGVTADNSISLAMRKANLVYFKEKWGSYPPDVTEEIVQNLDERYTFENHQKKEAEKQGVAVGAT